MSGSKHALVLDLMPYARSVVESKIDWNQGEGSIFDDAVQEGLLNALEKEVDTEEQLRYNIVRGINNFLDRHRERKNKGKMWQQGLDETQESYLWGDNPDFGG